MTIRASSALALASLALATLMLAVLTVATLAPGRAVAAENGDPIAEHSRALIFGTEGEVRAALEAFTERAEPDVAAAMILALRYNTAVTDRVSAVLQEITGHEATGWFDWMVWQEAHPEVTPHPSFRDFKLEVLWRLDEQFLTLFSPKAVLDTMKIRFEEVTWGGVPFDGIPALDNPDLVPAGEAGYLLDDDLVFGVEINGDTRAYPLRIMGWHEMFNEVIGGVPVALAYCTLCGSGILFETRVEGRDAPLVFGSTGLLYRSNKLMFDRATGSMWNQFTGRPVAGPLVDSGIELAIRPVAITSWARWRDAHAGTKVLSPETGHRRDYGSGVVYNDYFASTELMFPARTDQSRLAPKDYVFGIRGVGAAKAWPVAAFAGGAVINDAVGALEVVLVGDAATRSVRAYERRGKRFQAGGEDGALRSGDGLWQLREDALHGPGGARLPRVPGHVAYWFAWNGYLGVASALYEPEE